MELGHWKFCIQLLIDQLDLWAEQRISIWDLRSSAVTAIEIGRDFQIELTA